MNNSITITSKLKKLKTPLIVLIWLAIWQLISILVAQELLLVSPIKVCMTLMDLIPTQAFWYAIGLSLGRIILGFLMALGVGSFLAILGNKWKIIHEFFSPLLSIINTTPMASFIILALIWVKSSNLSTFIAFLMVLPVMYSHIYQGLNSVDAKLLEVGQVFALSPRQMIHNIYLPAMIPYLVSGCTLGLGLAWKSGVAAEVIGLPNNTIGIHLYDAKIYLETPDLFAWTLVIILLSIMMEKCLLALIKRLNKKIKVIF